MSESREQERQLAVEYFKKAYEHQVQGQLEEAIKNMKNRSEDLHMI